VKGAWWEYVAVFTASVAISWALTPLMLRVALRGDVVDHPGSAEHKDHGSPVPYLGGLAIVVALSAAVLLAAALRPPVFGFDELAAVLGMALALSIVGLLDDVRGLHPAVRVGFEVLAGLGIWWTDTGVKFVGVDAVDCVVTVIWVVGITNAFNLLDNMDGLSAGVAAICAASFGVIAAVNGQFLVGGLSFALAGCAVGFLRHNFHPARIYMGDAGSLYVGFLLAYLGLKLRFDAPDDVTFLVPVVALAIPILDTTLVTVARLMHRRSPFLGGRDHISHRLVQVGIPVRAAVGTIYLASASVGVIALVISRVDRVSAYVLAGLVLALGATAGVVMGTVSVYGAASTARRPRSVPSN